MTPLGRLLTPFRVVVLVLGRLPEESRHALRDVAPDDVAHVLVPLGHGGARPPHDGHRGRRRHSQDEENRRGRVPSVVQPSFAEAGIAYMTVRRGTQDLRDRSLIVTVHGKGTFVADPPQDNAEEEPQAGSED